MKKGEEKVEGTSKSRRPPLTREELNTLNASKNAARGNVLVYFERLSAKEQKLLIQTLQKLSKTEKGSDDSGAKKVIDEVKTSAKTEKQSDSKDVPVKTKKVKHAWLHGHICPLTTHMLTHTDKKDAVSIQIMGLEAALIASMQRAVRDEGDTDPELSKWHAIIGFQTPTTESEVAMLKSQIVAYCKTPVMEKPFEAHSKVDPVKGGSTCTHFSAMNDRKYPASHRSHSEPRI